MSSDMMSFLGTALVSVLDHLPVLTVILYKPTRALLPSMFPIVAFHDRLLTNGNRRVTLSIFGLQEIYKPTVYHLVYHTLSLDTVATF
jgi:hypothetical protein